MTRLSVEEIRKISPWLAEGWIDAVTPFADGMNGLVYVDSVPDGEKANKQSWRSQEVWGFAEVDFGGGTKQRKWVRKVHFTSKDVNQDLYLAWDTIEASE